MTITDEVKQSIIAQAQADAPLESCGYLLGRDDTGAEMAVSPDPMLDELQQALAGIVPGDPDSADGKLDALLTNAKLFGVSLKDAGLDEKVTDLFKAMLAGPGAVRRTIEQNI